MWLNTRLAPIITYESEGTLEVRTLVFINLKILISEKSTVEKI